MSVLPKAGDAVTVATGGGGGATVDGLGAALVVLTAADPMVSGTAVPVGPVAVGPVAVSKGAVGTDVAANEPFEHPASSTTIAMMAAGSHRGIRWGRACRLVRMMTSPPIIGRYPHGNTPGRTVPRLESTISPNPVRTALTKHL